MHLPRRYDVEGTPATIRRAMNLKGQLGMDCMFIALLKDEDLVGA